MLKTKKDDIMATILPAIIQTNKECSAWSIVNTADDIICFLEEKGYFQEKE